MHKFHPGLEIFKLRFLSFFKFKFRMKAVHLPVGSPNCRSISITLKRKIQLYSSLLLIAIYSFGMGLSSQNGFYTDQGIEIGNKQLQALVSQSNAFYAHTAAPESGLISIGAEVSPKYNPPFEGLWIAALLASKWQYKASFRQHQIFLRTTLVKSRKCDLIFPFHYFW